MHPINVLRLPPGRCRWGPPRRCLYLPSSYAYLSTSYRKTEIFPDVCGRHRLTSSISGRTTLAGLGSSRGCAAVLLVSRMKWAEENVIDRMEHNRYYGARRYCKKRLKIGHRRPSLFGGTIRNRGAFGVSFC